MPCTKRQNVSCGTLPANAMITVGIVMAKAAAVIRRFLPATSANAPVNGAVSAIAAVLAVISALISPAPTPKSWASSGSSACGEYRLTKLQKPAVATANERVSKEMRRKDMQYYGRRRLRKH